jgi:LPXTG-site transpeptidase (sortase) family protein
MKNRIRNLVQSFQKNEPETWDYYVIPGLEKFEALKETTEAVVEHVIEKVEEMAEHVVETVEEVIEHVELEIGHEVNKGEKAISVFGEESKKWATSKGKWLRSLNAPVIPKFLLTEITLPKISLPKIKLPQVNWQKIALPRPRIRPSQPIVAEALKESNFDKLMSWIKQTTTHLVRVGTFSSLIFAIGFLAINADAYSDIMMAWATQDLETVTQLETHVEKEEIPEQDLLAVERTPEAQKVAIPELNLDLTPPDNRLIIPKIEKNIPLISSNPTDLIGADWQSLEKTFQEDLKEGVVHYPGTAEPGELGNVFITGHSSYYVWDPGRYKDVFARLNQLEVGDDIVIYYEQEKHHYRVREMREVKNDDISVMAQPQNEKILTLMTCSPVGTRFKRLVVIAEEI